MLNNYVVQHKNDNTATHDYFIMHILKIMCGCTIVFMLDYIIIQHCSLFKKGLLSINNNTDRTVFHFGKKLFLQLLMLIFLFMLPIHE